MWRGGAARWAVRQEFLTKKPEKSAERRVQTLVTALPTCPKGAPRHSPAYSTIPAAVGNRNATVVQNRLFVSRRMVISVVAQGKWQRENNAAHAAVTHVQPFAARIPPVCAMPSASTSMPL